MSRCFVFVSLLACRKLRSRRASFFFGMYVVLIQQRAPETYCESMNECVLFAIQDAHSNVPLLASFSASPPRCTNLDSKFYVVGNRSLFRLTPILQGRSLVVNVGTKAAGHPFSFVWPPSASIRFPVSRSYPDTKYPRPGLVALSRRMIISFYVPDGFLLPTSPYPARPVVAFLMFRSLVGIKVVDGKFMEPKMPRAQMDAEYNATCEEIESAFQSLSDL